MCVPRASVRGDALAEPATTLAGRGGPPVQDPAGVPQAWSAPKNQGKWTLWRGLSALAGDPGLTLG